MWRALLDLVGTQDVPGLHRVFWNAKQSGWSVEKLLRKIQTIAYGTYQPKNFSELEFDLAITIDELGFGGGALRSKNTPFYFLHVPPFSNVAKTLSCVSQLDHQRYQTFLLTLRQGSRTSHLKTTDEIAGLRTCSN